MNPAEEYILSRREPYRSILMHLNSVIEAVIPEVDMKFKWGIPCFYAEKHPICYLNASYKENFSRFHFDVYVETEMVYMGEDTPDNRLQRMASQFDLLFNGGQRLTVA